MPSVSLVLLIAFASCVSLGLVGAVDGDGSASGVTDPSSSVAAPASGLSSSETTLPTAAAAAAAAPTVPAAAPAAPAAPAAAAATTVSVASAAAAAPAAGTAATGAPANPAAPAAAATVPVASAATAAPAAGTAATGAPANPAEPAAPAAATTVIAGPATAAPAGGPVAPSASQEAPTVASSAATQATTVNNPNAPVTVSAPITAPPGVIVTAPDPGSFASHVAGGSAPVASVGTTVKSTTATLPTINPLIAESLAEAAEYGTSTTNPTINPLIAESLAEAAEYGTSTTLPTINPLIAESLAEAAEYGTSTTLPTINPLIAESLAEAAAYGTSTTPSPQNIAQLLASLDFSAGSQLTVAEVEQLVSALSACNLAASTPNAGLLTAIAQVDNEMAIAAATTTAPQSQSSWSASQLYQIGVLASEIASAPAASVAADVALLSSLLEAGPQPSAALPPANTTVVNAVLNSTGASASLKSAVAQAVPLVSCVPLIDHVQCADDTSAYAYYQNVLATNLGPPADPTQGSLFSVRLDQQNVVWSYIMPAGADTATQSSAGVTVVGIVLIVVGALATVVLVAFIAVNSFKARSHRRVSDSRSSLLSQSSGHVVLQVRPASSSSSSSALAWASSIDV